MNFWLWIYIWIINWIRLNGMIVFLWRRWSFPSHFSFFVVSAATLKYLWGFIERNIFLLSLFFLLNRRKEERSLFIYGRSKEKEVIYSEGHCPVELSSRRTTDKKWTLEMKEKNEKMVCSFSELSFSGEKVKKTNSNINLFEVIFNAIVENQYSIIISLSLPNIIILTMGKKRKYKFFTGTSPKIFFLSAVSMQAHISQSFISHTLTMINDVHLMKSLFSA